MYEIWLMLNIVWEIALGIWPLLLLAAVSWLALMGMMWRQDRPGWRAGIVPAMVVGALAAFAATLLAPGWAGSSLSDMGYWVDWGILLALAAACGVVVAAFAWPVFAWRRGRSHA